MANKLLLLEDVDGLGRSGDIVAAKPGYVRNYLIPQKKAIIAGKSTLKLRARLQEERQKQATVDRKESEELAQRLEGFVLTTTVKVDPDGNLYGSVSTLDVSRLLKEQGFQIERKNVILPLPIRTVGKKSVELRLKEGVVTSITVEVQPERDIVLPIKEVQEEKS